MAVDRPRAEPPWRLPPEALDFLRLLGRVPPELRPEIEAVLMAPRLAENQRWIHEARVRVAAINAAGPFAPGEGWAAAGRLRDAATRYATAGAWRFLRGGPIEDVPTSNRALHRLLMLTGGHVHSQRQLYRFFNTAAVTNEAVEMSQRWPDNSQPEERGTTDVQPKGTETRGGR